MNKPTNVCNNCGKTGHSFHHCKLPITSYGIILFTYREEKIIFLMIRRKDTFGYIDFIRGKYSPYNIEQLQHTINEMSETEKDRLKTDSFEKLWKHMWGGAGGSQFRNEETISAKKSFKSLTKSNVQEINGLLLKIFLFLFGIPFEPLRAFIIAKKFIFHTLSKNSNITH